MTRYIDADKIDWRLIAPTNVINATVEEHTIYRARKLVESQPTADVVEVVYGEWIDSKDGTYYANCSICEYQMDVHTERGYHNYCPNCGAKMNERREDEN